MSNNSAKVRVLIADDHRIFREALRLLLQPDCEIIAEAESGEAAIQLAAQFHPQVVILDLGMPGLGGLAAAHRIARESPTSKVVVLSQYDDEEYVLEALSEAGVAGYVLKTDESSELLAAVRAVILGRRYVSPSIAPIVLGRLRRQPARGEKSGPQLTRREREVLRFIGDGATTKEVAQRLAISPKTVQVHRENLKRKLDLRSTAAMVRYAIKHKLIRID
jgi:DNA-binding NarL/FixJ family response regulator